MQCNLQIPQPSAHLPLAICVEMLNFILCRHILGNVLNPLLLQFKIWQPSTLNHDPQIYGLQITSGMQTFCGWPSEDSNKRSSFITSFPLCFQPTLQIVWSSFIQLFHTYILNFSCMCLIHIYTHKQSH